MALIKGNNADYQTAQAIVLDLGDLRSQADAILDQARQHAQQLIEDAKADILVMKDVANKEGYQDGFEQGVEEGTKTGETQGQAQALESAQEMLTQIQEAWIHAAGQWDKMRHEMISEAQNTLLKFALLTAEKVVHRLQDIDTTIIQSQVDAAIEYVVRPCDVRVHICPDDRPHMETILPEMMNHLVNAKHVQLIDDPEISRGGCVVDYGKGKIDATIESQMKQIIEAIIPTPQDSIEDDVLKNKSPQSNDQPKEDKEEL